VTHLAILFTLLGLFNVTFDPTINGVVWIISISISSFFTFGYFRLYEALIHGYHALFFRIKKMKEGDTSTFPGTIYSGNSLCRGIHAPGGDIALYLTPNGRYSDKETVFWE